MPQETPEELAAGLIAGRAKAKARAKAEKIADAVQAHGTDSDEAWNALTGENNNSNNT